MNFKNERLMMSKDEARKRAKELLNENQVDLITKYMFLEQQVKKQKEVIEKAIKYIKSYKTDYSPYELSDYNIRQILEILRGEDNEFRRL